MAATEEYELLEKVDRSGHSIPLKQFIFKGKYLYTDYSQKVLEIASQCVPTSKV